MRWDQPLQAPDALTSTIMGCDTQLWARISLFLLLLLLRECVIIPTEKGTKTALQQGSHRDDNLIRDIIEVPLLEPIEAVTANRKHCTNGYFNKWFLCLPTFLPSSPTMLEHLTFIGIRRRKGLRKDGQKPTSSFLSHLPNPNITRERERAEFHLLKGKKLF